jgi:hypothetical protein
MRPSRSLACVQDQHPFVAESQLHTYAVMMDNKLEATQNCFATGCGDLSVEAETKIDVTD